MIFENLIKTRNARVEILKGFRFSNSRLQVTLLGDDFPSLKISTYGLEDIVNVKDI